MIELLFCCKTLLNWPYEAAGRMGWAFCWHPVIGCDNKLYVCQDNRLTGLAGTDEPLALYLVSLGLPIVLAIVIILPKAVPVDQDVWWQQSALIPIFEGFESWGRQAVTDLKQLITSWM